MRSVFRDWTADCTSFPNELAEMALSHTIPSAVEKAYRRGSMFERRRRLMDMWGAFCGRLSGVGKVVAIGGRR
jgi:hypothetical protein